MKTAKPVLSVLLISLIHCGISALGADQPSGFSLRWPTKDGAIYQLQWKSEEGEAGSWKNLGPDRLGTGLTMSDADLPAPASRAYRVIEMIPPVETGGVPIANAGFEDGDDDEPDHWRTFASDPPLRTDKEAQSGKFSMYIDLQNEGAAPSEGLLEQTIGDEDAVLEGGATYRLSFWIKQVELGPSYVQQYRLTWLDDDGGKLGNTGFKHFKGINGRWKKVTIEDLDAPDAAADMRILFRFVTGAVEGGSGEVYVDDVHLTTGVIAVEGQTNSLVVLKRRVTAPAEDADADSGITPEDTYLELTELLKLYPNHPDLLWERVRLVLQEGMAQASPAKLLQAGKDLSAVRTLKGDAHEYNDVAELIALYRDNREDKSLFLKQATRWLTRYEESDWSRDVYVDTINGKVDQSDYQAALTLIDSFRQLYPKDPEGVRFQLLRDQFREN